MSQTEVERLFDRIWPSQIRKVASLSAQALSSEGPKDTLEGVPLKYASDILPEGFLLFFMVGVTLGLYLDCVIIYW